MASVPQVSARMAGSLTRSPGPTAPSFPRAAAGQRVPLQSTLGWLGQEEASASSRFPVPGLGSTCACLPGCARGRNGGGSRPTGELGSALGEI